MRRLKLKIYVYKETKPVLSPKIIIPALHLHHQIGGIYAMVEDTNKLYEIVYLKEEY